MTNAVDLRRVGDRRSASPCASCSATPSDSRRARESACRRGIGRGADSSRLAAPDRAACVAVAAVSAARVRPPGQESPTLIACSAAHVQAATSKPARRCVAYSNCSGFRAVLCSERGRAAIVRSIFATMRRSRSLEPRVRDCDRARRLLGAFPRRAAAPPAAARRIPRSAAPDSTFWVATTAGDPRARRAAHPRPLRRALLRALRRRRRSLVRRRAARRRAPVPSRSHHRRQRARLRRHDRPSHRRGVRARPSRRAPARPGRRRRGESAPRRRPPQVDILDVFGPYLSYEYHVDVDVSGRAALARDPARRPRPSNRASRATVADLFGARRRRADRGRARRRRTRPFAIRLCADRSRCDPTSARAPTRSRRFQFDDRELHAVRRRRRPRSPSAFPAAARAPRATSSSSSRSASTRPAGGAISRRRLPMTDDAGNDRWDRIGLSACLPATTLPERSLAVSIADSASREWPVDDRALGRFAHRLARPSADRATPTRKRFSRAFNQAAHRTIERPRVAARRDALRHPLAALPMRPRQDRPRKPARNVRAHDARACQQHGACVRRRHSVDDGQDGGDRGVSSQPRAAS